jgi:hypothetical protein
MDRKKIEMGKYNRRGREKRWLKLNIERGYCGSVVMKANKRKKNSNNNNKKKPSKKQRTKIPITNKKPQNNKDKNKWSIVSELL